MNIAELILLGFTATLYAVSIGFLLSLFLKENDTH